MLGEKQVIHKVFCIDSPIALVLLDSALGFQLCIRTWLGKVLKKKATTKESQRLCWCQCMCTGPVWHCFPTWKSHWDFYFHPTRSNIHRENAFFLLRKRLESKWTVTLTWTINTIFLPSAVRLCPKSSVGKNLVIFMLAFMCRSIILWAILVFVMSISVFSHCFDVKVSFYIFMQVWIGSSSGPEGLEGTTGCNH